MKGSVENTSVVSAEDRLKVMKALGSIKPSELTVGEVESLLNFLGLAHEMPGVIATLDHELAALDEELKLMDGTSSRLF